MKNEVCVKDKSKVVRRKNGDRNSLLRPVLLRPKLVDGHLLVPKRWMKLNDNPSCLVFLYKVWGSTGYGALKTTVLHKWHIKSVLRRAGWR